MQNCAEVVPKISGFWKIVYEIRNKERKAQDVTDIWQKIYEWVTVMMRLVSNDYLFSPNASFIPSS